MAQANIARLSSAGVTAYVNAANATYHRYLCAKDGEQGYYSEFDWCCGMRDALPQLVWC